MDLISAVYGLLHKRDRGIAEIFQVFYNVILLQRIGKIHFEPVIIETAVVTVQPYAFDPVAARRDILQNQIYIFYVSASPTLSRDRKGSI